MEILDYINAFEKKITKEIEREDYPTDIKALLWKIKIMVEITKRSVVLNIPIEEKEMHYFLGQTTVGKVIGDWDMNWAPLAYRQLSQTVFRQYWPIKEMPKEFNEYYIPNYDF